MKKPFEKLFYLTNCRSLISVIVLLHTLIDLQQYRSNLLDDQREWLHSTRKQHRFSFPTNQFYRNTMSLAFKHPSYSSCLICVFVKLWYCVISLPLVKAKHELILKCIICILQLFGIDPLLSNVNFVIFGCYEIVALATCLQLF